MVIVGVVGVVGVAGVVGVVLGVEIFLVKAE